MKILPTTSVERLAVRPVAIATQRTLTTSQNTGIVPPWLVAGSVSQLQAGTGMAALQNTGIVPPWLLNGTIESIPTIMPTKA